jgi:hypothetical protein
MSKQITLSEVLALPEKDTTGWVKTRAFIEMYSNFINVVDNGIIVGFLTDIFVRYDNVSEPEKVITMKSSGLLIQGYYFPKSHLHSFGRYTGLIILYNAKNLREVVVDPEQKPWHYEI